MIDPKQAAFRLNAIKDVIEPPAVRTKTSIGGQELLIWSYALNQHGISLEDFARGMMIFMATQKHMPFPVEIAGPRSYPDDRETSVQVAPQRAPLPRPSTTPPPAPRASQSAPPRGRGPTPSPTR